MQPNKFKVHRIQLLQQYRLSFARNVRPIWLNADWFVNFRLGSNNSFERCPKNLIVCPFPFASASFFFAIVAFIFTSCEPDGEANPLQLVVSKESDFQIRLSWTLSDNADGFEVWRINDELKQTDPELVATVDATIFEYWDQGDIPVSSSLTYYVVARVGNKEIMSNEVTTVGATYLSILPYQLELIQGTTLVIVREYSGLVLLDYERQRTVKRIQFTSGAIGQFGLSNDAKEVYVPCSDHRIYILKADDFAPIDTIDTQRPAYSVVVNNLGFLFSSGSGSSIKIYNCQTLSLISEVPGESDLGMVMQNQNNLITVSSHLSPATMSFFTFTEDGNLSSKTDDPYFWDYEMDSDILDASEKYIVISEQGFIYTADNNMTFVGKINAGGSNQGDFEFSADGQTIFSGVTDQKVILKSSVSPSGISSSSIPTKGYPWKMVRNGSTLVVLSSPTKFYLNAITNKVIIEKVQIP
jgi:hypothetical protein